MKVVRELDLEFSFPTANKVIPFDNNEYHSGSTIKRVDFIAEYDGKHIFIEIKDPDQPNANDVSSFIKKMKSGNLIQSLSGKFRDTLFFRSIQGNVDIDVIYIVLISMRILDPALLLAKQDELVRSIPIRHSDWARDCAANCIIMNVEQWKRMFGEHSIRRVSGGEA
ncbi:hypothetical protein ACCT03_32020 [Rhizobium johnstonii]|uniref:hypothetical protein n=1 Tax=Rhizobium johnstonii TaxID=3019933 RepID=UPI003F98935A